MRNLLKVLALSLSLVACGQSNSRQKEIELKEKELALKQKELELKEKEMKIDSSSDINKPSPTNIANAIAPGTYLVKADKSFFFNSPDSKTIRKGYIVKGDIIEIQKVQDDFAFGVYTLGSGSQITGWLLAVDLEKNTSPIATNSDDYKKFIGKWTTNSNNEIKTYYINYSKGEFHISIDWSKEFSDEMKRGNHMNILSNCANYVGKLKNRVLKARHTEGSSCDDEPEIRLLNENQIMVNNQFEKTKVIYTRQK